MCHLGRLLEEQGKIKSAESWFRKAAENDNPTAMVALNQLLEKHPWLP
jgi:TPR repeat protein